MNHKRRRPKNRRSGCLMCKPHKVNGYGFCSEHTQSRKVFLADSDVKQFFRTGE